MLRYRKAQGKAASINNALDAKIDEIKHNNFQSSQITQLVLQHSLDRSNDESAKIQQMANINDKRPDLDGEEWV